MPRSGWSMVGGVFLVYQGIPTAVFGTIVIIAGVITWGGITDLLLAFLAIQVLLLPLALAFTLGVGLASTRAKPTAYVKSGRLHALRGELAGSEYALSDCEWFLGSIRYVIPYLSGRALIIALPEDEEERAEYTAVGYTDESRPVWEAFLTLAGVRRRTDWEKRIGPARVALNTLVRLLTGPACVGGMMLLVPLLGDGLHALTGDADLSGLLGSVIAFLAGLYGVLYVGVLWPWTPWRPENGPSPEKQRKIRRGMALALPLSMLAVALPVMLSQGHPLHARLAASVFAVLSGWVVGWDLGRRLASASWLVR